MHCTAWLGPVSRGALQRDRKAINRYTLNRREDRSKTLDLCPAGTEERRPEIQLSQSVSQAAIGTEFPKRRVFFQGFSAGSPAASLLAYGELAVYTAVSPAVGRQGEAEGGRIA